MKNEISKTEQPCTLHSVRCSACVFYEKRGKTTGVCNKHLKSFFHYKTGKLAMSMNINVRSTWKCDDFVHYT
jgi:hypothetical protein